MGFNNRSEADIIDEIISFLCDNNIPNILSKKKQIENFVYKWSEKWRKCNYTWSSFISNNCLWLNKNLLQMEENQSFDDPGPSRRNFFQNCPSPKKIKRPKIYIAKELIYNILQKKTCFFIYIMLQILHYCF